MDKKIHTPELLSPAGSPDAFRAAIEGGADAIYMGGTDFNARINAKNFTLEELCESVKLAHSYGVKVYVTANTLIYDTEKEPWLRAAESAYLAGADALIVADLGAATEIKRRIPIDLHASTQMSGHNVSAAKYLAELGFTRMVCAREMSREELLTFTKNSPIEAEVFVHGALCVCVSGQCLFSSLVGGRSGNRGECAQPCRLPFKNPHGSEYPLSLKDLSLARHIPELCEMGIASFKIEGRMKSPEYVRDVTSVWRRLIDEGRGADDRDMAFLCDIFSRGGLTDGYYTKNVGSKMLGVRSDINKQKTKELSPFDKLTRKVDIELFATLRVGEPMSLTLKNKEKAVTVKGDIPEKAINAPLCAAAVEKNLTKLGNTPYRASAVHIDIDGELILPLSAINALRRKGIDALSASEYDMRSKSDFTDIEKHKENTNKKKAAKNSAYFHFPERIPREAFDFFDVIYAPLEKYDGSTNGIALPPVIYDSELDGVISLLRSAKEKGCRHLLVGNIGHIELAKNSGMLLHGDFRLNVTNSDTAEHFEDVFEDIVLSPELTLPKLRDIHKRFPYTRAVIYGRTPLMVTEKCIPPELFKKEKDRACAACRDGKASLTDRRGVVFPLLSGYGHRSIIVNSVPTYMADKLDELSRISLGDGHFIFTAETASEAAEVINSYKHHTQPSFSVRRIK